MKIANIRQQRTTPVAAIVLLALVPALLSSCRRDALTVVGNISNLPDGDIYLSVLDSNLQRQCIDTAEIKDGHFEFDNSLSVDVPECILLNSGDKVFFFFAGNDHISIEGDALKMHEVKVDGSNYHDIISDFVREMPEQDRLRQLNMEINTVSKDIDRRDAILEEMDNIRREQLAYIKKTIAKHGDDPIGPFLLINNMRAFTFDEADTLVNIFSQKMADYKYVRTLTRILNKSRADNEALKQLEIGKIAPDFELVDINGERIRLSSLRGKAVLLDFWASWCNPCRKNNKTLVELHNKFKSHNFEIVCVSTDVKKDNWEKAVAEDNLPGIQLLDSNNFVATTYCISTIPCSFLLDADGRIVSKDVGGQNIFNDVKSLLTSE